jgi:hypothetical protein
MEQTWRGNATAKRQRISSKQPTKAPDRRKHFGDNGNSAPNCVTLIIAPRRAMTRLLLRQQGCLLAEPMFERLGVDFDRLIQRHVH